MITLDWTILAAGTVFLFTLLALNQLLFKPLFRVLDERENRTVKVQEDAAAKQSSRDALFQEYSERLRAARQADYELAEKVRKEALEERQKRIADTRLEAEGLIGKARSEIREEMVLVKHELAVEASEIARMIASQVLKGVKG